MMMLKLYDLDRYVFIQKSQVTHVTEPSDGLVHVYVVGREDPIRVKGKAEGIASY